jgi:hypothetical protein
MITWTIIVLKTQIQLNRMLGSPENVKIVKESFKKCAYPGSALFSITETANNYTVELLSSLASEFSSFALPFFKMQNFFRGLCRLIDLLSSGSVTGSYHSKILTFCSGKCPSAAALLLATTAIDSINHQGISDPVWDGDANEATTNRSRRSPVEY